MIILWQQNPTKVKTKDSVNPLYEWLIEHFVGQLFISFKLFGYERAEDTVWYKTCTQQDNNLRKFSLIGLFLSSPWVSTQTWTGPAAK